MKTIATILALAGAGFAVALVFVAAAEIFATGDTKKLLSLGILSTLFAAFILAGIHAYRQGE